MQNRHNASPISILLVGIQVVCLIYIASTGPWKCSKMDLLIWQGAGILLALGGLFGLGRKSFSVFPEPKNKVIFVQKGIYAYIRHPMYAGIIIICTCLVWNFPDFWRWMVLGMLILVLVEKIRREERFLLAQFPEYQYYKEQTNRLIPFIW